MAKFKRIYICRKCGLTFSKWAGQCPECGAWNSLIEDAEMVSKPVKRKSITQFSGEAVELSNANIADEVYTPTGIKEFDRVLGGGVIKGQIILMAGPPGIGKSTLMLMAAGSFCRENRNKAGALYVSGEESAAQIFARAKRLSVNTKGLYLLPETDVEKIIKNVKKMKPVLVILDSIQTVFHPEVPSTAGSVAQIRECAGELLRICKNENIPLFILGHITKDGALAGPKMLEHMVDTVLHMDIERNQIYRILRSSKNRFGPTDEIGIFEMTEKGFSSDFNLFSAPPDTKPQVGKALSMAVEGTRCMAVEVQALVSRTYYPYPRRTVTGMDLNRAQVLIAAIEKNIGIPFDSKDIFVSVQGGIKIKDTAVDMAFCAAVISSAKNISVPSDWIFSGEVGILAQVSQIPFLGKRIIEAERLGFGKVFIPKQSKKADIKSNKTISVENLKDLFSELIKNTKVSNVFKEE